MIENKTIWITGAGSGIGKSLAIKLASSNNTVVISGRSRDKLQKVVDEASLHASSKVNIHILPFDVTQDKDVNKISSELFELAPRLDIIVACAGHCEYIDDLVLDINAFRRVFDVNVFGAVNTVNAAMPLLKNTINHNQSARPQIVSVASLSYLAAFPRAEAYGASKAANNYLFNALYVDCANLPIDVTVVNPGFVKTPMTDTNDFDMPFLMSPEDAAERIIKGIVKRKRVVNFPKRLLLFLMIANHLPFLWFGALAKKMTRVNKEFINQKTFG